MDPWMQAPRYPNREAGAEDMSVGKKFSIALPLAIVIAVFVVVAGALFLMNEAERIGEGGGAYQPLKEREKVELLTTLYSDASLTPEDEKAAVLEGVVESGNSDVSAEEKMRVLQTLQAQY